MTTITSTSERADARLRRVAATTAAAPYEPSTREPDPFDPVDVSGGDSFPASDPPSWWAGGPRVA